MKPDLSNVRLVELPPREVETPPPPEPDHGAIFVLELSRILEQARAGGLTDKQIADLTAAFVPDFPIRKD